MAAFSRMGISRRSLKSAAARLALAAVFISPMAQAHHSYAMFDGSKKLEVSGTVARLEWKNPHVYLWVYVPRPGARGEYDLWAFENGSPSALSARGWTRQSLKAGDRLTVDYWPLRDGSRGGHLGRLTWADGRELAGVGGPGTGRF
jgi:hypothetical protein